jgi:hypothetical protein
MTYRFAGVAMALAAFTATSAPHPRLQGAEAVQPREARDQTAPRFLLAQDLTDTPDAFARRLSRLLRAEVRLPEKVPNRLRLAAGAWTTQGALNAVARQINGHWYHVFAFEPRESGTAPTASLLPSAGKVTIHRERAAFAKMVRAIATEAGCRVELPKEVPQGRFHLPYEEIAVEEALEGLAAQANLSVIPVAAFEVIETDPERALTSMMEAEERQLTEELMERADTIARLEDIVGGDVNDEEFPWDSVAGWVWAELDLSAEEVESLRQEITITREMLQLSATEDTFPESGEESPTEAPFPEPSEEFPPQQ